MLVKIEERNKKLVIEVYNKKLVGIYQAFREHFHNPVSVLYPCCHLDVSPSQVFSNVTYIDLNYQII